MTSDSESGTSVEVVETGDVAVVALVGAHDIQSADHVRAVLSRLIDERSALVIDLSRAHLIDSTVLGLIITAHERGLHRAKPVVIVTDPETPPVVRNLLRLTGTTRVIDIYPTTAQALATVGGG